MDYVQPFLRDWADRDLDLRKVERYYEDLMSELERRETQFNSVLDRGDSLIKAYHPAHKVIEAHLAAMQVRDRLVEIFRLVG